LIPIRDDWKRPDFLIDPNLEFWFTDGSNVNDRFGAGISESRINHKENIPIRELVTVFKAEVLVILQYGKSH